MNWTQEPLNGRSLASWLRAINSNKDMDGSMLSIRRSQIQLCGLLTALLLLSIADREAFALPPRVIGKGELVIVPRPREAVVDPQKKNDRLDDIEKFLPQQERPPLLVHAFYYTHDLEFQVEIIPSGRYLLVANHPHSGCRCAVNVVLPDGAPIVVHRKYSITYLYPSKRVVIDFGLFGRSEPKVRYKKGQGTFRSLHGRIAKTKDATRKFLVKLPLTGALKDNGTKVVDTTKGAAALGAKAGTSYLEVVGKLVDGIPGVKPLQSLGQQLPELGRQEEIRQAGADAADSATEFIRTNR
jgi:hypothetical protein